MNRQHPSTNISKRQFASPMKAVHLPMLALIFAMFAGSAIAEDQVRHGEMRLNIPYPVAKESIDLGDGTMQHRLIANQPNGSIIVWYQDANPKVQVNDGLQKARDTIVKMAGGNVLSENRDNVGGQPARTFTVTMPQNGGEFRVGYYHYQGKNYQVMSVGTPEFTRSKSVDKMFESVRFEKQ